MVSDSVADGSAAAVAEGAAAEPFRVLMVCTANQVRSAMAERMLRHALASVAAGVPVEVGGAGTRTVDGRPLFSEAAAQLARRGIDASGFASRALTEKGVMQADLVLTATREHRSDVLERVPLALKRTFTLLEFAALVGGEPGKALASNGPDPANNGRADALRELVRRAAAQRGAAAIADDEYDIADPAGLEEDEFAYAARLIDYATATIAHAFARAASSADG